MPEGIREGLAGRKKGSLPEGANEKGGSERSRGGLGDSGESFFILSKINWLMAIN